MILHKAVIIKSQRYEKFKQVERNAKLNRATKQKNSNGVEIVSTPSLLY